MQPDRPSRGRVGGETDAARTCQPRTADGWTIQLTGRPSRPDSRAAATQANSLMKSLVSIILKYPDANFSVEGHTDSVGTKEFNQGLSQRRADAVVNYLSSKEVSSERLSGVGFGENNPIDTNVSATGRSNNRRVETVSYTHLTLPTKA